MPSFIATAFVLILLISTGVAKAQDPRGAAPGSPNPLEGQRFYVERGKHPAWRQFRVYRKRGQRHKAKLMRHVVREPKFHWFGRWTSMGRLRGWLRHARRAQPGAVPLMVVMRHQGERCGGYDAGGPREDRRARRWYRRFAKTVGRRRVVIGMEPDSIGTLRCLRPDRRRARLKLVRYGVKVFSRRMPNATIYLEGEASDWQGAKRVARKLRYIGIRRVRGFMLNATHHDWVLRNIRFGLDVSRRVGGKPFIINTATNGRGPVHYRTSRGRRINVWCHPLKRGLGPRPTTNTHHRKVDAYMWINRPGFSGGSCNGGPLPVGSWWPARALMLARYRTEWLAPPKGTRFGLYGHPTLREVAGDQVGP